jgi:hypothetical protein
MAVIVAASGTRGSAKRLRLGFGSNLSSRSTEGSEPHGHSLIALSLIAQLLLPRKREASSLG